MHGKPFSQAGFESPVIRLLEPLARTDNQEHCSRGLAADRFFSGLPQPHLLGDRCQTILTLDFSFPRRPEQTITLQVKVGDLLKCSRPLIFENEDEEFPYSLQGTGFLATLGSRYFGVTAKHCLRTRSRESIRLELTRNEGDFLPLKELTMVDGDHLDDNDFADLAFYEVDTALVETQRLDESNFLDLNTYYHLPFNCWRQTPWVCCGFPSCLSYVDYDRQLIHTQGLQMEVAYGGNAESAHCGVFNIVNPDDPELSTVWDFDGMSGAPMFQFEETPWGWAHQFAGVVIRATRVSGMGRFIHASVVYEALRKILARS